MAAPPRPPRDWAFARATIVRDLEGARPGTLRYTVEGPHQKGPNALEVLLPEDFDGEGRYPVVYLLPVNTGTDGPWGSGIVEAMAGGLHHRHRAIFVAPAFDTVPWYGDNPERPEVRQSSYLLETVVPFVDREFPTVAGPEGRQLVGFSKSGLGALSLFLRHPEVFGDVAAFDPSPRPGSRAFRAWGVAESFGRPENFDASDPMLLLGRRRRELRLRGRHITLLVGGPGCRKGAEMYLARLRELHIPFVAIHASDMAHTWSSGWLPLALAALAPGSAR